MADAFFLSEVLLWIPRAGTLCASAASSLRVRQLTQLLSLCVIVLWAAAAGNPGINNPGMKARGTSLTLGATVAFHSGWLGALLLEGSLYVVGGPPGTEIPRRRLMTYHANGIDDET